jgi:hypothetical protein
MEVNPLLVGAVGEGARALDARVRLWPGGAPPRSPSVPREMDRGSSRVP